MTKIDYLREEEYQITLMLLKTTHQNGWLTDDEFNLAQGKLVAIYQPMIGSLVYQSA